MKLNAFTTLITSSIIALALSTTTFASKSYYGNTQPKPKGYSYYKRDVQNNAYGYSGAKAKSNYGYNGYAAPAKVYRRGQDGSDGSDAVVDVGGEDDK
ncbi:hypothetical protein BJ165DRAFT_1534189 [Panaeolus papilionaceus]|nr:hypothetical protein BJ165DRAFT_1534189 [Panaeolus papilionaceus]